MYCFNCGKEVADGMQFCPFCGTQVNKEEPTSVNEATDENKLYDVILLDPGRARINVVKQLMTMYNLDLGSANKLVSAKMSTIGEKLSFEEALGLASKFEEMGAKVDIGENGVPYTPPTTEEEAPKKEKSTETAKPKAQMDDRKKKHYVSKILELTSAVAFTLASILAIFMPIFEKLDTKFSMLKGVIDVIPKLTKPSIYTVTYIWPVLAFVYVAVITVRAVLILFKKVKTVLSFEQVYENEIRDAKPESVQEFLKNKKKSYSGMILELLGNLMIFFFTSGATGISKLMLVVIGVMLVCQFALENVAKFMAQSANQVK